jgi:hypothetical protein
MSKETLPHGDRTSAVLRAAFAVSNELGAGFLEKVYEQALTVELRHVGCHVGTQLPVALLLNFGTPRVQHRRLVLKDGRAQEGGNA